MMLFVSLLLASGLLGSLRPTRDILLEENLDHSSNLLPESSGSKEVISGETFIDQSRIIYTLEHSYGGEADPKFNQLVDFLLDVLRETIQKAGYDQLSIPDINKEFTKKVKHFVKIKVKFHAEKGWFRSLASIQRTADATIIRTGNNITVAVGLGLGKIELGFDEYHAKAMHIRLKGKVSGKVGSNSLLLRVMIDKDKCKLALLDLKVLRMDGLKVKATGLGPFNWLLSKIATSITNHLKGKIIKSLEDHLQEAAAKALDRFHCKSLSSGMLQL